MRNPNEILPLKPGQKIAMIGPHANATMQMIQRDTGAICPSAANEKWANNRNDDVSAFDCVQSVVDAVQAINAEAGGTTVYAQGCDVVSNITGGFSEALAVAKDADVV